MNVVGWVTAAVMTAAVVALGCHLGQVIGVVMTR